MLVGLLWLSLASLVDHSVQCEHMAVSSLMAAESQLDSPCLVSIRATGGSVNYHWPSPGWILCVLCHAEPLGAVKHLH